MPQPPPPRTPNLELTLAELRPVELLSAGEAANVYRASEVGEGAGAAAVVVAKLCTPSESAGRERECAVLEAHPVPEMPRLLGADLSSAAVILMSLCAGAPVGTLVGTPVDGASSTGGTGPGGGTTDARHDSNGQSEVAARAVCAQLELLLGRLHAAGFAHGGIDGSSVLVDDAGAVALVGFRRVVFADEEGFGEVCAADLRAARSLADSLSTTSTAAAAPTHGGPGPDALSPPPRAAVVSGRVLPEVPVAAEPETEWDWNPEEPVPVAEEPRLAEVLDPALAAVGEVWPVVRSAVRRNSRRMLSGRRGRAIAIVVAAGAVLAVGVSLALDQRATDARASGDPPGAWLASASVSPGPTGEAGQTAATPKEQVRGRAGPATAARSGDERAQTERAAREEDAAILADDPVAAVQALLARRSRALASGELDAVQQVSGWGSPAAEADGLLLEGQTRHGSTGDGDGGAVGIGDSGGGGGGGGGGGSGGAGESAPAAVDPLAGARELALAQRLGDLAVVSARAPDGERVMSILVMKGGEGWRIRSYDDEPPGG